MEKLKNRAKKSIEAQPIVTALGQEIVDIALTVEGDPAFLVKLEGDLLETKQWAHDGRVHVPPYKDQMPWLLPRASEVLRFYKEDSDGALFAELVKYHKNISDLGDDRYYLLLAAFSCLSYLLEKIQHCPIISLYAVAERGKSRTGKGICHICYRGVHVESLNEAYIIRLADRFRATFFFDVVDLWSKAEKRGSEDIVLHRFEKGAKAARVNPDKKAFEDTVYYEVFGATVIATNESLSHILDTRAIQITPPDTRRHFENEITPEAALALKERLVAFRARNFTASLPEAVKPARGRLGDITRPLVQVVKLVAPEREGELMSLIKAIEQGRRFDKAESLDAQIIQAVNNLEPKVQNGFLGVQEITAYLNKDKAISQQLTPKRVGRRLKALGFDRGKLGNAAAIRWEVPKIEQLKVSYGLGETQETPEKQETQVQGTSEPSMEDLVI